MKFYWMVASCLFTSSLFAAECLDVFPDPAASYSKKGEIKFKNQALLIGSDGEITFDKIDDKPGGVSCDTQACISSETTSANLALDSFRESTSNVDITVPVLGSQSLQAGEFDDIEIKQSGELTLSTVGGTYVIEN